MPLLRTSIALTTIARRATPRSVHQPFATRALSTTQYRFSPQGYGDGEGDPRGENPQKQGSSNGTKQSAEHPGPEPVSEGKGSGAGPTKGGSSGSSKKPEDASAQSGGSRSKDAKETGSSPTGGEVGKSGGKSQDGSQPKIQDHKPSVDTAEKQAEVEQHNKEFEQGHDRAPPAAADKVDKKFWSGHGGADKEP